MEGRTHQVDDAFYREIQGVLREMSYRKCAYCECPLPGRFDVEHYRPKGAVAENDQHPGYYWLAYTWENLLAACTDCNATTRERRSWPDAGDPTGIGGKSTQFPLRDESARVFGPTGDLFEEDPLLIDPAGEADPETLLGFGVDGRPVAREAPERAIATIRACFLDRRRLNQDRLTEIRNVVFILNELAGTPPEGRRGWLSALSSALGPAAPYASAARSVVHNPADFPVDAASVVEVIAALGEARRPSPSVVPASHAV